MEVKVAGVSSISLLTTTEAVARIRDVIGAETGYARGSREGRCDRRRRTPAPPNEHTTSARMCSPTCGGRLDQSRGVVAF